MVTARTSLQLAFRRQTIAQIIDALSSFWNKIFEIYTVTKPISGLIVNFITVPASIATHGLILRRQCGNNT